jgi:hypothetical protein
MKLSDLMEAGGFVSETPVKKQVTWKHAVDGQEVEHTFDVFVRKQSFGAIEVIYGNETDRSKMAKYIAESICDEKGNAIIPYEKAVLLDPGLGTLFVKTINEVNGLGKAEAKN